MKAQAPCLKPKTVAHGIMDQIPHRLFSSCTFTLLLATESILIIFFFSLKWHLHSIWKVYKAITYLKKTKQSESWVLHNPVFKGILQKHKHVGLKYFPTCFFINQENNFSIGNRIAQMELESSKCCLVHFSYGCSLAQLKLCLNADVCV